MHSRRWLAAPLLVTVVALVFVAGCGPDHKARAKVKGKVKFFDKYLTAGTVAFTTKDGRVGAANIDFEGNYEMADAPIGEVTITVMVPKQPKGPKSGKAGPVQPPPGLPPMQGPGSGEIGKGDTPSIDFTKIVSIPPKYESVDTSGLKYTVEKGEHVHDITLTP